jgi:chemotaxis protein histidine kinase CheA
VVTRSGDQEIGLIVDTLVGEQEVVLKPLGPVLGDTIGISGATILGNGTVALMLDVASLIDRAGLQAALAADDGLGRSVPPARCVGTPYRSPSEGER